MTKYRVTWNFDNEIEASNEFEAELIAIEQIHEILNGMDKTLEVEELEQK